MDEILFPFEKIRESQKSLIYDIKDAIYSGKNILCHAPTGLGKTVAALGPALRYALDNSKTVFFLTSRHTQHMLALDTIKAINKKFGLSIIVADIIGKKWMCCQEGSTKMNSGEFTEYCRALRNDDNCEYYTNTYNGGKLSFKTQKTIPFVEAQMPISSEGINRISKKEKLCPYEIASLIAKNANVIITDYNYIFNSSIRENFLNKIGKKISESIIIIDEGHNLPDRCREMMSTRLSTNMVERAIKEAKKYNVPIIDKLVAIGKCLVELGSELSYEKDEDYVLKNEFKFSGIELMKLGESIREEQRVSFIGSVGMFLEEWKGSDKGFCRTISKSEFKGKEFLTLKYKCLDPSILSGEVINDSISTIMMSGTLSPTEMYSDILGFRNFKVKEYKDPFSEKK